MEKIICVNRETNRYGGMNQVEFKFALWLDVRKKGGEIKAWAYADMQFELGEFRCWYRPDFRIINNDNTMTFIETKGGFIREDAKIKFKCAAKIYPEFNWVMYQFKAREGWLKVYDNMIPKGESE